MTKRLGQIDEKLLAEGFLSAETYGKNSKVDPVNTVLVYLAGYVESQLKRVPGFDADLFHREIARRLYPHE